MYKALDLLINLSFKIDTATPALTGSSNFYKTHLNQLTCLLNRLANKSRQAISCARLTFIGVSHTCVNLYLEATKFIAFGVLCAILNRNLL